jgi:hypothetical protein
MGKKCINNRVDKSRPVYPAALFLPDRHFPPTEITQNSPPKERRINFDLKWVKMPRIVAGCTQARLCGFLFLGGFAFGDLPAPPAQPIVQG